MKLLKFYATWCEPCKGLSMIINGAKDKITVPIEDVNIEENMELAMKHGIRSVPTLVLVDENGEVLKKNVGVLNESQLLDFLIVQ